MIVRAIVRMRVDRSPMSSTVPSHRAHAAEVADPDRAVADDHHPAEQVLERLLRRERHGDAADAEAGEHRRQVDADRPEQDQDADHDRRRLQQPAAEPHERDSLGRAPALERRATDRPIVVAEDAHAEPRGRRR